MNENEKTKKLDTLKDNSSNKKRKRKISFRKVFSSIVLLLMVAGLTIGGVGLLHIKGLVDESPDIDTSAIIDTESSKILFADGTLMYDLGEVNREIITYEQMSQTLIDAIVSIEDSRFFTHNGFDLPRMMKSLLNNIKSRSFSEGGSTLTMQLIDNAYNSYFSDYIASGGGGLNGKIKQVEAKIQEIFMAMELEKDISKKQIIVNYFNKINFGAGTTRGVELAAQYYFGKNASNVTLPEAAFLAGVINAPNSMKPSANLENANKRKNTVLEQMLNHGYITEDEYRVAVAVKIEDIVITPETNLTGVDQKYITPINTVIKEVTDLGFDPFTEGMIIHTSIDRELQDTIESIERGERDFAYNHDLLQSSMVSIENRTGLIRAIGGGRNNALLGTNRATEPAHQPGSSMKSVLSYALAFEYLGWSTSHVVEDRPMYYGGTSSILQNYSRTYQGETTLRHAIGYSLNIPAYKALEQVQGTIGTAKIEDYLRNIGFNEKTVSEFDLQYSIGGSSFNVSPLEMAGAHSVAYNGGQYIKPHIVEKIIRSSGEIFEYTPEPVRVLSEAAAYMVTRLNKDVVDISYSPETRYIQRRYPVFAKTGTSNWGEEAVNFDIPVGAAKDRWLIYGTADYTTSVWVGFDKAIKGEGTWTRDSVLVGQIAGAMLTAYENKGSSTSDFARPEDVSSIEHILGTFPYARPVAGMEPSLITTGFIKRENAVLVDFDNTIKLSNLENFNAVLKSSSGNSQQIDLSFSQYPDPTMSNPQYDISLRNSGGGVVVSATGKRLFLPSWVYGNVSYKAKIFVNDVLVKEAISEMPNSVASIDAAPGSKIRVCGSYGYDPSKSNISSDEVCVNINLDDPTVAVPNFTTVSQLLNFIGQNGFTWNQTSVAANTFGEVDTLISVNDSSNQDIRGKNFKLSKLVSGITYNYYSDKDIVLPTGQTKAQITSWASTLGITFTENGTIGAGDPITGFRIAGVWKSPGDTVKLSSLNGVVIKK